MRSLHTATKSSPRLTQLERACAQQRRPNAAKNLKIKKIKNLKKTEIAGKKKMKGRISKGRERLGEFDLYPKTMTQQLRPGRLREGQQWEGKVEGPGESRFNWSLFRGWGTRRDAVYKTARQEGKLPSLAPTAAERKPSGKDG